MAERLLQALPVSVANDVKARQSLIESAVMWLATESGWARSKRSTIFSGKLCGGFIIFKQWFSCGLNKNYKHFGLVLLRIPNPQPNPRIFPSPSKSESANLLRP